MQTHEVIIPVLINYERGVMMRLLAGRGGQVISRT